MSTTADLAAGRPRLPGWRTTLAALGLYAAAVVAATHPVAWTMTRTLPSPSDPIQHLWIMKWYKSCLIEGRPPFHCPEIQYPVGAALGNFSPMHLQSALYLPLSLAIGNDVLIYNLLWFLGFLATGMGTFGLAWYVLRDGPAAAFAGLLGMLSGPMMIHALAHLELIYVGAFPLFLVAWVRFVDRPGARRALAAAGLYLLLTASAAYFVVLAAMPAIFYVAWRAGAAWRAGERGWLLGRIGPISGFVAAALPGLLLLFASQLWTVWKGEPLARSYLEFATYGAPIWGYFTPTRLHALVAALPCDVYGEAGFAVGVIERSSYLGLVALGLMHYAALHRVRVPRIGFWWATFALLVVLGMGAQWQFGATRIVLPSGWLWRAALPFRLLRAPGRFNLLAAVIAAVIAGAGLRHLLARLRRPAARAATFAALVILAVADLGMVPFGLQIVPPPMPAAYGALLRRDPDATILEVPTDTTASAYPLSANASYWQSIHRARTSAGYSGCSNVRFDSIVALNSPLAAVRLMNPAYLRDSDSPQIDLIPHAAFDDYAWLFLRALGYRHVMVHRDAPGYPGLPMHFERVEHHLGPAKSYDDGTIAVYDRDLLPAPRRPVLMTTEGWFRRIDRYGPGSWAARREASLAYYNPDADAPLTFTLAACALDRPRTIRLMVGETELARWRVDAQAVGAYTSPPFRLPAGTGELSLRSDGESRPTHLGDAIDAAVTPYSFRAHWLRLAPAAGAVEVLAVQPGREAK